ncbi:hypothetical protein G6F56_007212 [Rhizopus delemar]|nr:hypothetical protein G6F56_007212 [Rhizopus delemar]
MTHTSLLLTSKLSRPQYYPPSPPLSKSSASKDSAMSNPYSLSIEKALQIYGSQPELLGLVLYSKLEEDRRKTEEAKLRQKEIDYLLQRKKNLLPSLSHSTLPPLHHTCTNEMTPKPSISRLLISPRKDDPELKSPELSPREEQTKRKQSSMDYDDIPQLPPSPPIESIPKRRKRAIQAITTIIETKEFPYSDDYLWKNNGNTTHRKSGLKSVYYKCSNSARGCLVNKTVTFKNNGEYLIKYRGEHLQECSRIKRITDL